MTNREPTPEQDLDESLARYRAELDAVMAAVRRGDIDPHAALDSILSDIHGDQSESGSGYQYRHEERTGSIGGKIAKSLLTLAVLAGTGHVVSESFKPEGVEVEDIADDRVEDLARATAATSILSTIDTEHKAEALDGIEDEALQSKARAVFEYELIDDISEYTDEEEIDLIESMLSGQNKRLFNKKMDLLRVSGADLIYSDDEDRRELVDRIKDPALKKDAQKIVDLEKAKNVHLNPYSLDENTAKESTEGIHNEEVKQLVQEQVDIVAALHVLNKYAPSDSIVSAMSTIADPNIAASVEGADQLDDTSRDQVISDYEARLDKLKTSVEEQQDEIIGRLEMAQYAVSDEILMRKADAESDLEGYIESQTRSVGEKIAPSINIGDLMDGIKPGELIQPKLNKDKLERIDLIGDDGETEEALRFADISVDEAGGLTLRFAEGAVDARTQKQLRKLYKNMTPYLEAAFKAGDIARLSFIVDDYEGAYFMPTTREIVIPLAEGNAESTSMDQIVSTTFHELLHALTQSEISANVIAEKEYLEFVSVCNALADDAYNKYEALTRSMSEKFEAMKQYLPEAEHEVVDEIKRRIQHGDLDVLLRDTDGYDDYSSLLLTCEMPFTVIELADSVATTLGYSLTIPGDSGIYEDEDIIRLDGVWEQALRSRSVYALLNESNFVDTDHEDKERLGHSEDSINELVASFMNAAVNYENQFIETLKNLDPAQRGALVKLLRLSVDMIAKDHPSLAGTLGELEARVLDGLN